MAYSIYFVNKANLYLELGFKNSREAKHKLEEIANCFVGSSNAVGEIWVSNKYVDKVTHYEITYKENKPYLHYTKSKKNFKNFG